MTTDTQGGITAEARKLLRAPFAASAVKWLPAGGIINGNAVLLIPYINASLVFERLSEVDPSWTHETKPMLLGANPLDPFGTAYGSPWECTMTVLGVERHGLGQLKAGASMDEKYLKTGYSDAIKRAALEFEVGAYLRAVDALFLQNQATPMFTITASKKYGGLTAAGKIAMRTAYERIVSNAEFVKRYGEAIEYGDAVAEVVDDVEVPAVLDAGEANEAELDVLVTLSKYNGRSTPEDTLRATLRKHPFPKVLARAINGVAAALAIEPDDAVRLQALVEKAATGDSDAVLEMADVLDQLQTAAESKATEATS